MSTHIQQREPLPPARPRDEIDDFISEYELTLEQEIWPECTTCFGECYFVVANGQRFGSLTWIERDRERDPNISTIECETCHGSGKQQPGPGEGGF